MEMIYGYDNWKLASPDYYEPEPDYCECCDTEYYKDDGEFCECHCQDCGEELPFDGGETPGEYGHCTNCCDCDACMEADAKITAHHEATGEWLDHPEVYGEKVYSKK